MVFVFLYLKGNVKAQYLSIAAKTKVTNDTKSVIGTSKITIYLIIQVTRDMLGGFLEK